MMISSIDLMDGAAVQLIGGRERALNAGDPRPIADRWGPFGELAVIDLDAALGRGDNRAVILDLIRRHRCRVGGGIRTADQARAWLDAGAARVIVGTAATPELLGQLPRDRVIAAVDAVDGEVVVEGWRTRTGRSTLEVIRELAPWVGGFLVTFVEREGRLGGAALDRVGPIVEAAGSARVTIAGGVSTAAEVAHLDRMGADAQVGMALYTGRLTPGEAMFTCARTDRPDGLVPTVVCDERGMALGLVWSNAESLRRAEETGRGVYWSRSRGEIWEKGKSSGATQRLVGVDLDCDRDTLRFRVTQSPPGFCHEQTQTCWGPDRGLGALDRTLGARAQEEAAGSYTRRLLADPVLLAHKLREEVEELIAAPDADSVAEEIADVLYFALVAGRRAGVGLAQVEAALARRAGRVTRRAGDAKTKPAPSSSTLPRRPSAEVVAARGAPVDPRALAEVAPILADVRDHGEVGLIRQARRLGDLRDGEPLVVGPEALRAAFEALPPDDQGVLRRTADRIRAFARARRADCRDTAIDVPGGRAGVTARPVGRAGCYAPGGRHPLPSSVLMTAITAREAGVGEVWLASPRPSEATLAAAWLAGVDGLLAVGGAQAIAALVYGAGPVPRCDVVVGPGNRWVTAAKQVVAGTVGIDMLAGPSELLVVADASADPRRVAADLLAQAEHDEDARPMLISLDHAWLDRLDLEISAQLTDLPTAETARRALANGFATVAADRREAAALANLLAPEHLALHLNAPEVFAEGLTNYGALFLGEEAAEVLGDYGAGPNHVLPTGGTARAFGALDVLTFLRPQGWLRMDTSEGARELALDAARLARIEGLEGHARAADLRASPR